MEHQAKCTGTKRCARCGATLHVLAFSAEPRHSDGLRSSCRECDATARQRAAARNRGPFAADAVFAGSDL